MTTNDETRPLIREGPTVVVHGYSSHAARKPPPAGDLKITLKGVVGIFFAAVIVFALAAITSRTILWGDSSSSSDSVMNKSATSRLAADPEPNDEPSRHGLVKPLNGTHPTLTSTQDCTGDLSYPVLAGADVVAYFSLEDGSKPVIARGDIRATYRSYVFFFVSVENRNRFESDPERYLPAWGGFCSYGIAKEPVWKTNNLGPFADPSKWKILSDNRLHVFRSDVPMEKFSLAAAEYLAIGDTNWNAWFDGGVGPLNTACFCAASMCNDE